MRLTLIALSLLLSSAAYAAEQPAGDVPTKEAKEDTKKVDADTVKASAEEDAQPDQLVKAVRHAREQERLDGIHVARDA